MSFFEEQLKAAASDPSQGVAHDYQGEDGKQYDRPNEVPPLQATYAQQQQPPMGFPPQTLFQDAHAPQNGWHQGFPMMSHQIPMQQLEQNFMGMQVQGHYPAQGQYPGFGMPQMGMYGQPFPAHNAQFAPAPWGLGASPAGAQEPSQITENSKDREAYMAQMALFQQQQMQMQQNQHQQQMQQQQQMHQLQQQQLQQQQQQTVAGSKDDSSETFQAKVEPETTPKASEGQDQSQAELERAHAEIPNENTWAQNDASKKDSISASNVFDRSEKRSLPSHSGESFERRGNRNSNQRGGHNRAQGQFQQHQWQQQYRPVNAAEQQFNNLMGDWDKVRVMRIQLQQLISQDPYNEDFYYQVYNTIRERRDDRAQPLDLFSKTYLFQRGGRRYFRYFQNCGEDTDDTLSRLQQQVQAVVEKVRGRTQKERSSPPPKGFGRKSGVTPAHPRKLLPLSLDVTDQEVSAQTELTRESILTLCESAFEAVLAIESHMWAKPDPDSPDAAEWAEQMPALEENLWKCLEVRSAPDKNGRQPFISMLALDKGKKLVPRAFSYLDNTARLTVLTRIFHQIDDLDVIKNGNYRDNKLSTKNASSIQLFVQTALQPLVQYIGELELETIDLLIDMILSSTKDIISILRTEVGQAFFTVLISRSELIHQEGTAAEADVSAWRETFSKFFALSQPHLSSLFPPSDVSYDYVWNFLAALALGADLEQQRSIVDSVRERIFATMAEARTLPETEGEAKIANLNLLLNVMGLNATFNEVTALEA